MINRKNRTGLKFLAAVSLAVSTSLVLTGCFIVEGPKPDAPEREQIEVVDEAAVLVPSGSADENKDFFFKSLQEFADGELEISGQNITGSLVEAGFEAELMQVTFDESKTDLPADTITVSVLFEEECLLGQIERRTRKVYLDKADALGPNNDVCILGITADF